MITLADFIVSRVRPLDTIVEHVEGRIRKGDVPNATLCDDTPGRIDFAFKLRGWEPVTIGKGEFYRKGHHTMFTRGQGERGQTIVQWGKLPEQLDK